MGIPLGFANLSFNTALKVRGKLNTDSDLSFDEVGIKFDAFVISSKCDSFKKVDKV